MLLQKEKLYVLFLALCVMCSGVAPSAYAELSGTMKGRWVHYDGEVGEDVGVNAESFSQQYSIYYRTKNKIGGGRGGRYDLGLGYEYNVLDVDVDKESSSIKTGKVLFRGELALAPGGLPFRLNAFSHDNFSSQFNEVNQLAGKRSLLDSGLPTQLRNGQYVVSGLTLLVGIRNGSYLGSYRDILSRYPRLLIDFRQVYRRDVKGTTPAHTRLRDLAFISLNKKDNWFHYRLRDFRNFLNGNEDYQEYTYTLGTIDPALIRKWVNLTNWIKLSVDGTYNVEIKEKTEALPVHRYNLNFFSTFSRGKTRAHFLGRYNREREGERLEKDLFAPLKVRGELGRDGDWTLNVSGEDHKDLEGGEYATREKNIFLSGEVNLFKRRTWKVQTQVHLEQNRTLEAQGLNGRVAVSTQSNFKSSPLRLAGRYSVSSFKGENDGVERSSFEQELFGRGSYRFDENLEVGGEWTLLVTTGGADAVISGKIKQDALGDLYYSDSTIIARDRGVFHSKTEGYFDVAVGSSFKTRGKVLYDSLSDGGRRNQQLIFEHSLSYGVSTFLVELDQSLAFGDIRVRDSIEGLNFSQSSSIREFTTLYNMGAMVSYRPSRTFSSRISSDYEQREFSGGVIRSLTLGQEGRYTVLTQNGVVRDLWVFKENLDYTKYDSGLNFSSDTTKFKLAVVYNPKHIWKIGASTELHFSEGEVASAKHGITSTVVFEKLKLICSYAHGQNFAHGDNKMLEDRWEVSVDKTF